MNKTKSYNHTVIYIFIITLAASGAYIIADRIIAADYRTKNEELQNEAGHAFKYAEQNHGLLKYEMAKIDVAQIHYLNPPGDKRKTMNSIVSFYMTNISSHSVFVSSNEITLGSLNTAINQAAVKQCLYSNIHFISTNSGLLDNGNEQSPNTQLQMGYCGNTNNHLLNLLPGQTQVYTIEDLQPSYKHKSSPKQYKFIYKISNIYCTDAACKNIQEDKVALHQIMLVRDYATNPARDY